MRCELLVHSSVALLSNSQLGAGTRVLQGGNESLVMQHVRVRERGA